MCVCVSVRARSCMDVYQHVGVGGRLRKRVERNRRRAMMLREEKGGRTVCSEVRERGRGKKGKRHQERERRGGRANCL